MGKREHDPPFIRGDRGDCRDLLCDSLVQNPGLPTGGVGVIVEMLSIALIVPGTPGQEPVLSEPSFGSRTWGACCVPRHPVHRVVSLIIGEVMKKTPGYQDTL